ncbi:hypothetical protein TIFTF001_006023 [Ficus carica]|uniref:Uncharacterized protein n=1 Tax=Ficus carica TaxID=3494 RepID=A0AA87ZNC7_FICCA|nr:hypothetical protein TIFTF001_006023 [Ficus carica]
MDRTNSTEEKRGSPVTRSGSPPFSLVAPVVDETPWVLWPQRPLITMIIVISEADILQNLQLFVVAARPALHGMAIGDYNCWCRVQSNLPGLVGKELKTCKP